MEVNSVIKARVLESLAQENIGFTNFWARGIIIGAQDGAAFYCIAAYATELQSGEVVQISAQLPIN